MYCWIPLVNSKRFVFSKSNDSFSKNSSIGGVGYPSILQLRFKDVFSSILILFNGSSLKKGPTIKIKYLNDENRKIPFELTVDYHVVIIA